MVLSIIDLGSNSIRMDIVNINEETGEYNYLERCRELVRLSEGMNMDGSLQPEPMERAIDALREFKAIMNEYKVNDVVAVATAAVRKAKNGDEFCGRALDETGISINVIKGEQEAEYDFLGVMGSLDIEDCIIVDTGGGSTEFILVNENEPLARTSIPVGAVNMTEQFLYSGETAEALSGLSDYISSQLDKIHWLDDTCGLPIVCLGGSLYNLAVVNQNAPDAGRIALHGTIMTGDSVVETFEELMQMSPDERHDAGIESGRVDTIICGIMPTVELINKTGSKQVIISTAGLKEGILTEFISTLV